MTRLIHGFKIVKHRNYIFISIISLCAIIIFLPFLFDKIGNVSLKELYLGLGLSFYRLFLAYILSLVVALIIAIFISQTKIGDFFIPVLDLLQNLPSFALIPLFVYFFGYTNIMVIIFAASSILWPILFYVLHTLKTTRSDFNAAAKIFGAVGWKKIFYYLLPLSFSSAVTGSIVGFSIGWEAVIGVEIIGLTQGIGVFLNGAVQSNKESFVIGISALLLLVFIINRLVWMPLLKKSQLYAE